MKVYLASKSPRRKELLAQLFDEFEIVPSDADETVRYIKPSKIVKDISLQKLKGCVVKDKDAVIIACDTIVYFNKKLYGKPTSIENAIEILSTICGKYHIVYSGVSIAYKGKVYTFAEKSKVKLRNMTAEEIKVYVNSGLPMDKAGAYGIQDGLVESYSGSYENIMGLPIQRLKDKLVEIGVLVR